MCSIDIETIIHYFLYCYNYSIERLTLLNTLRSIDGQILKQSDSKVIQILVFDKNSFNVEEDASQLKATIEFILAKKMTVKALI